MKKLSIFFLLTVIVIACENQPQEWSDNSFQSVYFPIQKPIRTLSLGEDRLDNSLDREYKYDMGVSLGGAYYNKKSYTVDYKLDTSILTKVYTSTSASTTDKDKKVLVLPQSYYTLDPASQVTIPKGSFNGRIRVQLTSAFFDDTLAITGLYCIPLRITDTSADTILSGKAAITGADFRIASQWESNKSPKDWVMYGIKYVNAYHGTYLHRGRDIRTNISTSVKDTVKFRNRYVEKDALINLKTCARNKVFTDGVANLSGTNSMTLTFDNDKGNSGTVTITPRVGAASQVTGSGQYFNKADSQEKWTLLTWQSMYLSYTFTDATYTHAVTDTLVFRDRGIVWQEYNIVVK